MITRKYDFNQFNRSRTKKTDEQLHAVQVNGVKSSREVEKTKTRYVSQNVCHSETKSYPSKELSLPPTTFIQEIHHKTLTSTCLTPTIIN